jgi:hypothetical protein
VNRTFLKWAPDLRGPPGGAGPQDTDLTALSQRI